MEPTSSAIGLIVIVALTGLISDGAYNPSLGLNSPFDRYGAFDIAIHLPASSPAWLYALNQAEKFILAIVFAGEGDVAEGPHYIRKPFKSEPDWGVASINFDLNALLQHKELAA